MIKIQNIYYMLAYAFQVLKEEGYASCGTEDFENTTELLSAILAKGIAIQIKRGLLREYLEVDERLSAPRGKINITNSIKEQTMIHQQLVCEYDDFSVNSYMNRILKTTMVLLLKSDVSKSRKKELRGLLLYFKEVEEINWRSIDWNVPFNRNNQTYQMLINICWLIIKGLLQTETAGNVKMNKFLDEQKMHRLYEKFILEYYRQEYRNVLTANASQIPWQLDDEIGPMLPKMQTDIMLTQGNRVLIIDAKYYQRSVQTQFNVQTVHSGNLYQIFTYVKNKEYELRNEEHEVAGMLLYARTDEEVYPNNSYMMSGNQITVKTLDLNLPFSLIRDQLDKIVNDFFVIS